MIMTPQIKYFHKNRVKYNENMGKSEKWENKMMEDMKKEIKKELHRQKKFVDNFKKKWIEKYKKRRGYKKVYEDFIDFEMKATEVYNEIFGKQSKEFNIEERVNEIFNK